MPDDNTLRLEQCQPGQIVDTTTIWLERSQAMVVAKRESDGWVMLAWKDKPPFSSAWTVVPVDTPPFPPGYKYGYWCRPNWPVVPIGEPLSTSTHTGGMQCCIKSCGTYCQYAVPNAGDKFICYSCKTSGRRVSV